MKKILITGCKGFIGRHLVRSLENEFEILGYDLGYNQEKLIEFCESADCIIHLAGLMRSDDIKAIYDVNYGLTAEICSILLTSDNKSKIILASSRHSGSESDYGKSKFMAEKAVLAMQEMLNNELYVYRLPNLFGPGARPNYGSVVATWCNNAQKGLGLEISDSDIEMSLYYVDDLINDFKKIIKVGSKKIIHENFPTTKIKLGDLKFIIEQFALGKAIDDFQKYDKKFITNLYKTYRSYGGE